MSELYWAHPHAALNHTCFYQKKKLQHFHQILFSFVGVLFIIMSVNYRRETEIIEQLKEIDKKESERYVNYYNVYV